MMTEPRCYHCGHLLADIDAACPRCLPCFYGHDFERGSWGVIFGVSRCKRCGEVATPERMSPLNTLE